MMKRTKFPYKYQKEQACICPDCRKEVFKYWLSLVRRLYPVEGISTKEMIDELPFPVPEEEHLYQRKKQEQKDTKRKRFFSKGI